MFNVENIWLQFCECAFMRAKKSTVQLTAELHDDIQNFTFLKRALRFMLQYGNAMLNHIT